MTHVSSLSGSQTGDSAISPPAARLLYRLQPCRGFTLAELIVALMLLTVGLLALSSTSAFVTYELASSARSERAAAAAASRLEALRSASCADAAGSSTSDGITTAWSVAAVGRGATSSVEVTYADRGKRISQRYSSGFACRDTTTGAR